MARWTARYGFNAYLLAVGLLSRLLGQDVMQVWGTLAIYGLLVYVCAAYLLAARLFNSVRLGVVFHFSRHHLLPPCSYANPSWLTHSLALTLLWNYTELQRNPCPANRLAFGAARGEYVCWFDADGQHRAEDLMRLVRRVQQEDADWGLGVREKGSHAVRGRIPASSCRGWRCRSPRRLALS